MAIGQRNAHRTAACRVSNQALHCLDVVSTSVTVLGTNLVFSATLNANVGTTAQGFYICGVNRGAGIANFASLGLPNAVSHNLRWVLRSHSFRPHV